MKGGNRPGSNKMGSPNRIHVVLKITRLNCMFVFEELTLPAKKARVPKGADFQLKSSSQ